MLGIPGGATTALLLVALTVHGIRPGTLLFSDQPDLVYGFLVGLLFGAVMFLVVSVPSHACSRLVTLVRAELLAPIFLVISVCRRVRAGPAVQRHRRRGAVRDARLPAQMFGFPPCRWCSGSCWAYLSGDVVLPIPGDFRGLAPGVLHASAQRRIAGALTRRHPHTFAISTLSPRLQALAYSRPRRATG